MARRRLPKKPAPERWSKLGRIAGFALGFGSLVLWPITGEPPQSGTMTFAAGLIALPVVQELQHERNWRRDNGDRRDRS